MQNTIKNGIPAHGNGRWSLNKVTCLAILGCFGCNGIARCYIGDTCMGVACFFFGSICCIGTIYELYYVRQDAKKLNEEITDKVIRKHRGPSQVPQTLQFAPQPVQYVQGPTGYGQPPMQYS